MARILSRAATFIMACLLALTACAGTARGKEYSYAPSGTKSSFSASGNEAVFGLVPAPEYKPAAAVEFTVMSYNIQNRPFFDNAEEKLPKISPLLNGFDVVLIQECFQRHDLLWADAKFPNKAFFGALAEKWKATGSGLSMFSLLPAYEARMAHYDAVGELQNKYASKGILLMRLMINGLPVDIYDTHMEAGDKPEAQAAHLAQAKQLIDFVKKNSPPDHSVIIAGDFNMGPFVKGKTWQQHGNYSNDDDMKARTDTFKVLMDGLGLLDAYDILNGPGDTGIERFLYRPGSGHILEPVSAYSDNEHYRRADGSSLSDGSPRIARFRISAK